MNREALFPGVTQTNEPPTDQVTGNRPFPVVGIGASAGGIGALKQFFARMPADPGMAFVVILHLSQEHESSLAQILQTQTAMPVAQVTETVKVEPSHVYVIPPAKHLELVDGIIKLKEPNRIRGKRVPIDLFFRTLADAYGKDGIAVVLSGTGSDGTLGVKRVKEFGGLVLAQSLDDAEYDGMPRSAIDTGLVDVILPVAEMPEKILRLSRRMEQIEIPEEAKEEENATAEKPKRDAGTVALRELLTLLRVRTGHDFTNYKRPTLLRRIARRLQVHELDDIPAYLDLLRENPDEVQQLLRDLLITVTNFFRDREAFEALETEVVPRLFADKTSTDTVRVWVAGCATGEEAYSLAMLLCEYADKLTDAPKIQIFASDINEEAIRQGRDCRYDEMIAADVSPERLRRFFNKEGNVYRVKKALREMVLFAPHNLLRDPPFSRLDLISCRNLLIYFNRETQERVLEIFNFALRNHGFLFLGSSETAEGQSALFTPVDKKQRIYRSRPSLAVHPLPAMPIRDKWTVRIPELPAAEHEPAASYAAPHLQFIEKYAPPSVIVNEEYDIVHSSDNAGRFLRFASGEPSRNLLKAVNPALHLDLRATLMAAKQEGRTQRARHIRARIDGVERMVNLIVHPSDSRFLLVIFEEEKDAPVGGEIASITGSIAGDKALAAVVQRLEEELQTAKDRLRHTLDQSETSTEELKASNEELQAINEELRSASEELETSKEELQSVNEELITVNHELRSKVGEVTRVNSDLQNLMQSTDIVTLFLDRGLRIKFFTPNAQGLFNLIPSDLGRPLKHVTHTLNYEFLTEDAEEVMETLRPKEREVRGGKENGHYLVRLTPYRTLDDRIDGVVLTFVDVTGLRQSEEDLRESEERYSAIVKQTTAGMLQTELDGKILFVNDRFCDITGYERDELLKMRRHDLMHKEDLPHSLELFEQAATADKSFTIEKRYVRKNGSLVWVHNTVSAILGADGKPKYILVVTLDITGRKQTEEELQKSEEKYRTLFNSIDEGFCVIEVIFDDADKPCDYRFLEANPMFEELTGLENAVGKTVLELVPNLEDFWIETYGKVALTGKAVRFENHSEPMNRWFDVHASRVGNETSRKVALVFTNITERKRTEKALRASEEKFRTLSEAAPALIWFDDPDGNCLYVNQQYVAFSGKTLKELEGNGWQLVLHPEDAEDYINDFLAALSEQRPFHHRVRAQRHDGKWRWIESYAQPLFAADGAFLGHVGISPDITDSVNAEQALKDADRRKDEFLATLAHELRNPLAPIRSAVEIMRRADSREKDQQAREIIERQLLQIIRLVDDLLDVSRITQGKINLQTETVELRQVIEMALETVRPAIDAAGHTLEISLPGEPVYLDADITRLTQVFLNLLTNATRYTESGGKISIEAEAGEKQVEIRVCDTGQGISAELLPRVFGLFTQGQPARQSGQSGLGIGLSLVKRLAEMHDGTVEAQSDGPGNGSQFIVRLPLAAEQKPAKKKKQAVEETPPVNGEPSPRKVLVVDDNTDSAEMMKAVLTMDGHNVRVAYNGQTAIDTALEFQPDLMFLDLGLPDIDGYEVATRIRHQLPNTLLVALSGWGQESDRRRTQEAGFDRHLVKPLDFDILPELLATAGRDRRSPTETYLATSVD